MTTIAVGKWNYTLKSGAALRSAIGDGDAQMVVLHLITCYRELLDEEYIDADDYEQYVEEVRECIEDDEVDEDAVDYELHEFYDLCDALRVWIPF